jgi:hypothetical protein
MSGLVRAASIAANDQEFCAMLERVNGALGPRLQPHIVAARMIESLLPKRKRTGPQFEHLQRAAAWLRGNEEVQ